MYPVHRKRSSKLVLKGPAKLPQAKRAKVSSTIVTERKKEKSCHQLIVMEVHYIEIYIAKETS